MGGLDYMPLAGSVKGLYWMTSLAGSVEGPDWNTPQRRSSPSLRPHCRFHRGRIWNGIAGAVVSLL